MELATGWRTNDRPEEPGRVIEVDDQQLADLKRVLAARLERPPTDAELQREVREWIQEEILVREARALGLADDDPVVRSHLAEKMAFVLSAREVAPQPTDADLRALWQEVSGEFALTTQLTLRHYFVQGRDAAARERAEKLLERARAGASRDALTADSDDPPGGPVLRGRTLERLEGLLGAEFVSGLDSVEPNSWELRPSPRGWHLVSVLQRRDARQLSFEEARSRLAARWQARRIREASDGALRALEQSYQVRGWPR